VTAGDEVYVGGTITELTGKDISGATIVVALLNTGSGPTSETEGTEPDIDEKPTLSQRTVKKLINSDVAPGSYQLWGRITDTPEREWLRLDTVTAI
jgi:hypothetical protein